METQYLDWPWEPMDTIPVDHELNTLLRLNPEFPLQFHTTICLPIRTILSTGTSRVPSKSPW